MAYDETLADRTRQLLDRRRGFTEKTMFGGVGFLLNGNMCVGIWKSDLIVRLGREQADAALSEEHVKPFDITGRAMKGWAMVEPNGTKSDAHLQDWVLRSIDFVKTLPEKEQQAEAQTA